MLRSAKMRVSTGPNTGRLFTYHKQEGGRSMAKQLAYDADARSALKRGVDKVADAVRITIGPKGRNVVLDKRSEEHTSELQSQSNLVCRLLLEKKKTPTFPLRTLLP